MATTEIENPVFFKLVAQLHEITAQLVRQHQHDLEAVVLNSDQLRSNLADKTVIYLGKGIASEEAIEVGTDASEQGQAFSCDLCDVSSNRDCTVIQMPRVSNVKSKAGRLASSAPERSSKENQIVVNANAEQWVPSVDQLLSLTEVDTCRAPTNGDIESLAEFHTNPGLPKAGESNSPGEDGIETLSEGSTSVMVFSECEDANTRSQDAPGKSDSRSDSLSRSQATRMSIRSVVQSMAHSGSTFAYMIRHPWNEHLEFQNVNLSEFFKAEGVQVSRNSDYERRSERLEKELTLRKKYWYMIHPESKLRGLWVLISLTFLLTDFFMVPVSLCFGMDGNELMTDFDVVAMAFWTADICCTFMTGDRNANAHLLEMRPTVIARGYLKSWFFFDLGIVLPEWILMAIETDIESDAGSGFALMRLARWGRLTRLLRMARIVDFKRLKPMVRSVIYSSNIPKVYIEFIMSMATITCEFTAFVHILTCFWFLVGSGEGGWVDLNALRSYSVGHSYAVALHWTLSRLQGIQTHNVMQRSSDLILDSVLVYLSFIFAAYYSGILIAFAGKVSGESFNLWRLSIIYVKRHGISKETEIKINRWLEFDETSHAKAKQEEEWTLLQALPESVQNEVIFEVRSRSLADTIFFYDLLRANAAAVRQLCLDAMSEKAWSEGEILWTAGDLCSSMVFVTSGGAHYVRESFHDLQEIVRRRTYDILQTIEDKLSQYCIGEQIPMGCPVSEPVLWTQWTHQGALVATEELESLSIDPIKCAVVLKEYRASLCHAVKYANHFCRKMNILEEPADDLTRFPELVYTDLDIDIGDTREHLMFLSHYKVEAGTEATLMRDSFHQILQDDPNHPANLFQVIAFIDSEDLTNLAALKKHVVGSLNLVLLLTPCVLSRPWCLVEIVTAVRYGIEIVPVEIQRPGSKYTYPDDAYYAGLLQGQGLPPGAVELLGSEGITLMDVEQAIRQVFLKIALSFSPHKTRAVRDAELRDILKRCSLAKKT